MPKQGTKAQFKAHDRAAKQAKAEGKSDRQAAMSGLAAEFAFLTGAKF